LVAGIDNRNLFNVPDGYFESVIPTVLVCIHETVTPVNIVDSISNNDIPGDYFNLLSDDIMAKIKAQKELSSADELKEISFILAGINKTNPFQLPEKYFEELPSSILSETGIEKIPAVLNNLQFIQPFEVPQGYFENLPAAILNEAQQTQRAKVVSLKKPAVFIRYAAAAVITGALALGVFKYANQPAAIINNTPTAQLEPFIEKGKNMDDKKFNETLNSLSQDDIAQYLEKNGSDADISVLITSVEESDLPNQEDYLLDNKTLDNFLQEIDTRNLKN
jgi:hypothetical protein